MVSRSLITSAAIAMLSLASSSEAQMVTGRAVHGTLPRALGGQAQRFVPSGLG